ncbi:hypothetical protein FS373_17395 [Shewanella sp. YLB-07]|nr:hypothetical protein [Shewanella sp. YLB-07]
MKAVAPSDSEDLIKEGPSADENPASEEVDSKAGEIEEIESTWTSEMNKAFDEGRFDDADLIFKQYSLDEQDETKLLRNKSFYLYLKFEKQKDNSAIEKLEDLARIAKSEDSKFNTLTWLSFCFQDSMTYGKQIDLWRSALAETKSEKLRTRAIVNLASVLSKDDKSTEAKSLLVKRLLNTVDESQQSTLYTELSNIEKSLGNKHLSIYCKDKSLEFDVYNRDELFNSAHAASDEGIDEISISNYIKLIRIDSNNSMAFNNLGVRALDAGLNIKAIENYKKSSKYNNTLAMANQGYTLLEAGFADEAESIANQALKLDDPHKNVYSLISAIDKNRKNQSDKWSKLREKSFERQKFIRKYIEQYYLGDSSTLNGDWLVNNAYPTTILINKGLMKATWVELAGHLGDASYTAELTGKVYGSTFEGIYTKKKDDSTSYSLLGLAGNIDQSCIGFLSEDGNKIKLFSPKFKDDFSLSLLKNNT